MATRTAPKIDLLSTASFSAGQPHEQFRWLRENDPVGRRSSGAQAARRR